MMKLVSCPLGVMMKCADTADDDWRGGGRGGDEGGGDDCGAIVPLLPALATDLGPPLWWSRTGRP